jgi:hypothetical protein
LVENTHLAAGGGPKSADPMSEGEWWLGTAKSC